MTSPASSAKTLGPKVQKTSNQAPGVFGSWSTNKAAAKASPATGPAQRALACRAVWAREPGATEANTRARVQPSSSWSARVSGPLYSRASGAPSRTRWNRETRNPRATTAVSQATVRAFQNRSITRSTTGQTR